MEGVNGGNISGQVQEGVYEGVGNGWGTASGGSRRGENGVDVKGWSRMSKGSVLYLLCLWMRV